MIVFHFLFALSISGHGFGFRLRFLPFLFFFFVVSCRRVTDRRNAKGRPRHSENGKVNDRTQRDGLHNSAACFCFFGGVLLSEHFLRLPLYYFYFDMSALVRSRPCGVLLELSLFFCMS